MTNSSEDDDDDDDDVPPVSEGTDKNGHQLCVPVLPKADGQLEEKEREGGIV